MDEGEERGRKAGIEEISKVVFKKNVMLLQHFEELAHRKDFILLVIGMPFF